jgi:hypothetical protein
MARPRVACDQAEIPRTLEGNRKAARRNEAAVLHVETVSTHQINGTKRCLTLFLYSA